MGTKDTSGGGWFLSALTLLFITLKLTGHIAWSWWWVLSPMWIPLTIGLLIICIAAIFIK